MEARPIISSNEKLRIILDSRSIENLLDKSDRTVNTILSYHDCEPFEFIRTPLNTNRTGLAKISKFEKVYSGTELIGIDISSAKRRFQLSALCTRQGLESLGQSIYKKRSFSAEEMDRIELIFVQASFNKIKGLGILVTEDGVLLKKRYWLEKHFPGCLMNIFTVDEAVGS